MGVNSIGTGSSNKTFFNLFQGELVLEYDKREELEKKLERMQQDPEPHGHHKGIQVRQRVKGKNEGKDVFYYVFNNVSGMISNVVLRETDFGEFLNVEITDVDEVFVLSLGDVFGRFAKDFIRRAEGLDLEMEVIFGTWTMDADNGKTYSGVRMYQHGEKIEYQYANEDLPKPIQKKKGGKVIWDFSEQEEFLYNILETYLANNFKPDTNALVGKAPPPLPPPVKKEIPKKEVKKKVAKEAVQTDLPWDKEDKK